MNEHLKEKTANQKIHRWFSPQCGNGHDWEPTDSANSRHYWRCTGCGASDETFEDEPPTIPAYDTDLNKIAEVEAKVIETFGEFKYLDALTVALKGGFDLQIRLMMDDVAFVRTLATAPASVRAAAIVALIEEKENG